MPNRWFCPTHGTGPIDHSCACNVRSVSDIVSLDSRVSYIAPGRHCLMCAGIVTPRQLRFNSLTAEARQDEIALGYSDDLVIDKPAVMDLNMRAAGAGMLLLRHLLQPFLLEPLPVTLSENAVTYMSIPVSVAKRANPACPMCQGNRRQGYGDCGPRIGFEAETVRRIMGCVRAGPHPVTVDRQPMRLGSRPCFLGRAVARLASLITGRSYRLKDAPITEKVAEKSDDKDLK